MAFDIAMIKATYARLAARVEAARKVTNKPLTASEKILYSHLWDGAATQVFNRGVDYVDFAPDRIACQDATAQMALLQFMQASDYFSDRKKHWYHYRLTFPYYI